MPAPSVAYSERPVHARRMGFGACLPFTIFFKHLATPDCMDIFSHTAGPLFAAVFWKVWYREKTPVE